MKPAKTITPPDWAREPDVQKILQILNAGSEVSQAMFVGGCVRNQILSKSVEDIDIATKWTPEQVSEKLRAAAIKVIPTGIEHGTVTAVAGNRNLEITTLRRDVETDGRRAVVAYSDCWREDAHRRDFTMNTLLMDAGGAIFDPTESGLKDLAEGRVVFVGDPATRIAEDVLRILRFFRFHAMYGKGEPDAAALRVCRDQAHKIPLLSRERITQEFFKIMSIENPSIILKIIFENNIIKDFSKFSSEIKMFDVFCEMQKRHDLISLPARILVLAGLSEENVESMQTLTIIQKNILKEIRGIAAVLKIENLESDRAVRRAVYRQGRAAAAQALMILLAQGNIAEGQAPQTLDIIQSWDIPKFPVTGEDLMKQGYKPGPELGAKLKALEEEWIENDFPLPPASL